jgi:tripartite-type tricarboxylate transporter receptor subunit TctC
MERQRNAGAAVRRRWFAPDFASLHPGYGLLWLALAICSTRAIAAEDEFFKGKTVTLVVGYSVGGGYDQYARVLARHFGSRIPGNPSVLVQNMPGAASLTAVRYLDASAAKDGTAITTFDPGLITESFASPDIFKIRFSDFQWIGTMLRDIRICYAWGATGIKTWDDMMKRKEFLIGTTAKGSNAYVNGAILRKIFNAPVRQIAGYPGSNEQRLALERGELEGNCGSWSAMPQDWVVHDKFNPLVRFSPKRPADMPQNVPFIGDLATTVAHKDLLAVLNASAELGRPFIVAKTVPPQRVNVLRAAFRAALDDAAFQAEARAQSLPLDPVAGEEAAAIINKIYSASPELARKVKDVLE